MQSPELNTHQVCPDCGRCPTCGRYRDAWGYPWRWSWPLWPQITWTTTAGTSGQAYPAPEGGELGEKPPKL